MPDNLALRFNPTGPDKETPPDQYVAFIGKSDFVIGKVQQVPPGFPNSGNWRWFIHAIRGIEATKARQHGEESTLEGAMRSMSGSWLQFIDYVGYGPK